MVFDVRPSSPRAARTRAALLQAGLHLLADHTIDAIAVDQIVDRAGVAKGSFFNHFDDKHAFATAVADAIRGDLEGKVTAANEGLADPFARLARGMRIAAEFALRERRRTLVMLRSADHLTGVRHPLNKGVSADIQSVTASGSTWSGVAEWGALYWLGLCQVLMADIAARAPERAEAADALAAILACGLAGLGLSPARASILATTEILNA
jgi:AcrR family transcriptional regulator